MATSILLIDNGNHARLAARFEAAGCDVLVVRERNEAVRHIKDGGFDGVLVNPALFPDYTCQELVQRIRRRVSSRTALIILTRSGCLETCRSCPLVRMGRLDCVDMPAPPAEIVARMFYLMNHPMPRPPQPLPGLLSPREREVLSHARAGLTNQDIAEQLSITEKVVEKHITHLCRKLEVANRTEAVALSYRKSVL